MKNIKKIKDANSNHNEEDHFWAILVLFLAKTTKQDFFQKIGAPSLECLWPLTTCKISEKIMSKFRENVSWTDRGESIGPAGSKSNK